MIEYFTLKDYPYEERRMDFFKQKHLEAERRWNFYNDVVVKLGGEDGESDGEKEL